MIIELIVLILVFSCVYVHAVVSVLPHSVQFEIILCFGFRLTCVAPMMRSNSRSVVPGGMCDGGPGE